MYDEEEELAKKEFEIFMKILDLQYELLYKPTHKSNKEEAK